MQLTKWVHEHYYMNIEGQGHSLTLVQGHSDSTFSNSFFLETALPIEDKGWRNKSLIIRYTATMPIYGKKLKNHLLWNQKADDLEN